MMDLEVGQPAPVQQREKSDSTENHRALAGSSLI
jgi:hypothetical protein